jgi:ATP-dependent Lhr-like helicase
MVADEPMLYVERGGRGLVTLGNSSAESGAGASVGAAAGAGREADPLHEALRALAEAVRAGRVPKLALERIDGEPAIGSELVEALRELGFSSGPRKLTLSA